MDKDYRWFKIILIAFGIAMMILLAIIFSIVFEPKNEEPKKVFPQKTNSTVEQVVEKKTSYTEEDVALLARLIHGEARGEPYKGQVAVGAVVLNRMKSKGFPNTMEEVIFQKNQFTCVSDGQFYLDIPKNSSVYKAAREALEGSDPSKGCVYFYNPEISTSSWIFENTETVVTIGSHRFAVDK